MGLFDSVYVDCPHCGEPVEFQSKADDAPYMNNYTLETAPGYIIVDIMNKPQHCLSCDGWMVLTDPKIPIDYRPQLVPKKVRTPDNPRTHFQGFKWWPDDLPFTTADILEK